MSENVAAKKADAEKIKVNEAKWSKPLMAAAWTAMPSVIIEKQEALELDALDMNIILHLSHYWWTPDNLPHPSVETIAKAVGVKPRTVQKRFIRDNPPCQDAARLLKRNWRHCLRCRPMTWSWFGTGL